MADSTSTTTQDARRLFRSGACDVDHLGMVASATPLDGVLCDRIVGACRALPIAPPTTVGDDRYPRHRACTVQMVPANGDGASGASWIYDLLWAYAVAANDAYFHLDITGFAREAHYCEYTPGDGHFHWHDDYSHERSTAPRKLTAIVQLSENGDYEGGDLEVFGIEVTAAPRDRGTVIVLPSFVYHRVTAVTAGRRRALVSWISGPRLM